MSQTTDTMNEISAEARQVLAQLQLLWQDEGVEQLEIFLDPDIYSVLTEIKETSLEFIAKVAALAD